MQSSAKKKITKKTVSIPVNKIVIDEVKPSLDVEEISDTILLDNILDKNLINFDSKHQMSMFFIVYKSINALYKELLNVENYTIPDKVIKQVVLEIIPSIIKEYNSNLHKRRSNNTEVDASSSLGADRCDMPQEDSICLARTLEGVQCSRKKYYSNDFCYNHIKHRPNGCIDIPLTAINKPESKEHPVEPVLSNTKQAHTAPVAIVTNTLIKEPIPEDIKIQVIPPAQIKVSKRGRKSKIQFDPRQYDNEYLTLWEDIVEGEKVLVDNANNIYTFNLERPVYIGKKDITKKLDIRKFIQSLT